jgi:hypothetical protein
MNYPKSAYSRISLVLVVLFASILLPNCKKTDVIKPETKDISELFFNLPANASPEVQSASKAMKEGKFQQDYLKSFIEANGYPVWEKAIYTNQDVENNTAKTSTNAEDIVFIPCNINNEIKSYILSIKTDTGVIVTVHSKATLSKRFSADPRIAQVIKGKLAVFAFFEKTVNNKEETIFNSPLVSKMKNVSIRFILNSSEKTSSAKTFSWKSWTVQICWPEQGTSPTEGQPPAPPKNPQDGGQFVKITALCESYNLVEWTDETEEVDPTDPTGGGTGEQPDANGFYPSKVQELWSYLQNNPYGLIPCNAVASFMTLGNFQAPSAVTNRIAQLNQTYINSNPWSTFIQQPFYIQNINDASSSVVNCDYFPIRITTLPTVNGVQMTAGQLFEHFRKNFNQFINNGIATFAPYNTPGLFDDGPLYMSSNPLTAMLHLNMVNDGTVIVSDYYSSSQGISRMLVKTMRSPLDIDHPVSGNRAWGIFPATNSTGGTEYVFYTQGVDRITNFSDVVANSFLTSLNIKGGFDIANLLWESLQDKMVKFITDNGGSAQKYTPTIYYPNWDDIKDFYEKKITLQQLIQRLGC